MLFVPEMLFVLFVPKMPEMPPVPRFPGSLGPAGQAEPVHRAAVDCRWWAGWPQDGKQERCFAQVRPASSASPGHRRPAQRS